MNVLLVFLIITSGTVCSGQNMTYLKERAWIAYKSIYNKSYPSTNEDNRRFHIYLSNIKFIDEHNEKFEKGSVSYLMFPNEFTDWTDDEVLSLRSCMGHYKDNFTHVELGDPNDPEVFETKKLPKRFNWVEKGAVTRVKSQMTCQCCYAFASVAALESRYYIKNNRLISLSEQNVVDCSGNYGNKGCDGGFLDTTFTYMIKNGGINSEKDYPYENKEGRCRFKREKFTAKPKKYYRIDGETALKRAVARGPVAVGVNAEPKSFNFYKSGVYEDSGCRGRKINHGMTVVGYGTDPKTKKEYWLIKNSWSEKWGESGYMKLRKGVKMCNIGEMAFAPVV